jgi:hypothetical protein
MAVVQSAWGYTEANKNRFGQRGAWMPEPEVACMMAEPDVLALLVWLRARDTRRLAAARRRLIELEYIVQITRAHQGSPALYRWA